MYQLIFLAWVALLSFLDQVFKWLAVQHLSGKPDIKLIKGVLELTYVENRGIAWGLFPGMRWLVLGVTSLVIGIVLYVFLTRRFGNHRLLNIGGVLVAAGGVGNLIDRLVYGYVVDFIQFKFIDFPVFNFADCCVVIGAVLILIYFFFFYSYSVPAVPGAPAADQAASKVEQNSPSEEHVS